MINIEFKGISILKYMAGISYIVTHQCWKLQCDWSKVPHHVASSIQCCIIQDIVSKITPSVEPLVEKKFFNDITHWRNLVFTGFRWSDGSPVDFDNWSGPGRSGSRSGDEESDVQMPTDQDCVGMYQSIGAWHRLECDALKNWICKIRRGTFFGYCFYPIIVLWKSFCPFMYVVLFDVRVLGIHCFFSPVQALCTE